MNKLVEKIAKQNCKNDKFDFNVGDNVKVNIKIIEGKTQRIQAFIGDIIAKKSSNISETITVRRVSFGQGVEKTFPIHSPNIESIKVLKRGKVRRAKLYYLRDKIGKSAKIKEKRN